MSQRIPWALSLALSILGHALVLLIMTRHAPELMEERALAIEVSLLSPSPEVSEPPPPPTDTMEPEIESEPSKPPEEQALVSAQKDEETLKTLARQAEEPDQNRSATLINSLQQQIPALVTQLNPLERPKDIPNHRGAAVPKLPGQPSVLDHWLGPVQTDLDRWVESSGEINARVTLASGHVVCIQIRQPSTQELFNPWMSAAIPMTRVCGRERPKGIDLEDPWLRTRPKAQ